MARDTSRNTLVLILFLPSDSWLLSLFDNSVFLIGSRMFTPKAKLVAWNKIFHKAAYDFVEPFHKINCLKLWFDQWIGRNPEYPKVHTRADCCIFLRVTWKDEYVSIRCSAKISALSSSVLAHSWFIFLMVSPDKSCNCLFSFLGLRVSFSSSVGRFRKRYTAFYPGSIFLVHHLAQMEVEPSIFDLIIYFQSCYFMQLAIHCFWIGLPPYQ